MARITFTGAVKSAVLATVFAASLAYQGAGSSVSAGTDRHAGYYYPPPKSGEQYDARARRLANADRLMRLGFVTGITVQQLNKPELPDYAIFAKGNQAEKLIIVGLQDGRLDTLYRARAVLAQMTAVARTSPIFRDFKAEGVLTFLDLCKMLGFEQLTISDGKTFSHQITIR